MRSDQGREGRRLQFTIRTLLVATVFVALVLGWYRTYRGNQELLQQLMRAQSEIWRARSEIQREKSRTALDQIPKGKGGNRGLSAVCLDGADLRGISINGGVFQVASFKGSDLRGATLIGGGASFQGARFDGANLANATLTGGGSSFQSASFVNADLANATLTGGGASFQAASFEGATLIDARVIVPGVTDFQCVNIDGAQFQGADLSTIDPSALESCYFETPPRYNTKTKFPEGFDPAAQGWARAE